MKLFKISAMMLAGLALGACSSSDDAISDGANGSGNNQTGVKSWVGFRVQLPEVANTPIVRANDDLDDGTAEEYDVVKADLFLFQYSGAATTDAEKEADGDNMKFIGAYSLSSDPFNKSDANGCTTEAVLTAEIINPDEATAPDPGVTTTSSNIYAYVVLNGAVTITANNNTSVTICGQNITNATTWTVFKNLTLPSAQIGEYTVNTNEDDAVGAKRLLMTNAPLSASQGGSATPAANSVSVLRPLDATKIFNTEAQALSAPAAEIYVERAAAKVTVTFATMTADQKVDQTAGLTNEVTYNTSDMTWDLGNINKTFFPSRQYDETWNDLVAAAVTAAPYQHRFIADAAIHEGAYRTFWAKDPNYNTGNTLADDTYTAPDYTAAEAFDKVTLLTTDYQKTSGTSHYTIENTMDENGMQNRYSPYVGVKASLKTAGAIQTFWTLPGATGQNTIYTASTDMFEYIKEVMAGMTEFETWNTGKDIPLTSIEFELTGDNKDDKGLQLTSTSSTTLGANANSFNTDVLVALKTKIGKIYEYTEGVSYYLIPIRHFGEDMGTGAANYNALGVETPWNPDTKISQRYVHVYPTTGEGTDASRAAAYLGRYGVIRNNWYQLEIDGIKKIGSPVPITPDETPDDEVDKYLSVKIHVTPWVIRKSTGIKL